MPASVDLACRSRHRVAGDHLEELGYRADVAGADSVVGVCSLPRATKSWPTRSSLFFCTFQTCESERSVAGVDAEVGELADERVRDRLEDQRGERLRSDRAQTSLVPSTAVRRRCRRGGEISTIASSRRLDRAVVRRA